MPASLPKDGDGFRFREFLRSDAEALAEIEFDTDVKRYLALPQKKRAEWTASFDPELYGGWAVEVDGTLAGRVSILRAKRNGEGEIAVVIAKAYWGLRLGRRVADMLLHIGFEEMNATALVGQVHPENRGSLALLRALRFRRSGVLKAPGSWQDGHIVYRKAKSSYNKSVNTDAELVSF